MKTEEYLLKRVNKLEDREASYLKQIEDLKQQSHQLALVIVQTYDHIKITDEIVYFDGNVIVDKIDNPELFNFIEHVLDDLTKAKEVK